METIQRSFPSKLLLLGEYTVLVGGPALAIPFPRFSGHWTFEGTPDQRRLPELLTWLTQETISEKLHLDQFEVDLRNGMSFQSTIPEGYGLGSSGALSAAIYHRYQVKAAESLSEARVDLATLEGFFHGASSGLDPLVSYSDKTIYVDVRKKSHPVEIQVLNGRDDRLQWFLLDTHIQRESTPLIQWFLQQLKEPDFEQVCRTVIAPKVDFLIRQLRSTVDPDLFFREVQSISQAQFEYWTKLIPSPFLSIWEQGLNADSPYTLKLCGAGGGGFILGLSRVGKKVKLPGSQEVIII